MPVKSRVSALRYTISQGGLTNFWHSQKRLIYVGTDCLG